MQRIIEMKWEYDMIPMDREITPEMLDRFGQMGERGWELCAVGCGHFIFKRPLAAADGQGA